jgi:hypothetical protein
VALELGAEQVELLLGERRYRVRGLAKNSSLEQLRVNLRCERGEDYHQDNVDLYSARARHGFIKQAAGELGLEEDVIKRDVGKLLRALEELHEKRLREQMGPRRTEVKLSEQEREEALSLLRDPQLLERILEDFERCGLVGEKSAKLLGYFAAVSRLLEQPLGVLIQSSSAAGKSSLMWWRRSESDPPRRSEIDPPWPGCTGGAVSVQDQRPQLLLRRSGYSCSVSLLSVV